MTNTGSTNSGRPNRIDEVREQMVCDYYQQEMPVSQIMELTGVCPNTLYAIIDRNEIPRRQPRGSAKYASMPQEELINKLVPLVDYLVSDRLLKPQAVAEQLGQPVDLIERIMEERL